MSITKRIPFDAEKAKKGAKVVTRCGYPVRIGLYDAKYENFPILGVIQEEVHETPYCFTKDGKFFEDEDHPYDLFIEEEAKTRYMTFEELALWLIEKPGRQYMRITNRFIGLSFGYYESSKDNKANDYLIREGKGEWQKPLVEVEELKDNENEEV